MAETEQRSPNPLAPASGYSRSDTEAAATSHGSAAEQRRKNSKRTKCLLYIFIFAVFQTGIILLFTFTIMKIRTPKFRVRSATFDNFNVGTPTDPSLNITMNAELGVKNTNFGRFKFETTTVYFYYRDTRVDEVSVDKGKVNWQSTKKLNVLVNINVADSAQGNSQLANDLRAGIVPISSQAKMKGNVRLVMMFKKKRSIDMNCTMEIVIEARQLRNIVCK